MLESPDCPLCGGRDARELFVARDRLLGRPGTFPVVRCAGCGLVFLRPRPAPAALATYYPETYYPLDDELSAEARAAAEGLLARVSTLWPPDGTRPRRLLDVGSGSGLFLHYARQAGWETRGIELSPAAAAYARGRFGLDVQTATLEVAELPDGAFDVVTMWHVLEHLPDPVAGLRRVTRLLAPGGLLLLAVPNSGSLEARFFGRRWYSLDAPRHLVHFTPETLSAAILAAGLEPREITHSTGTAGLVYSLMGDLTGVVLKLRGRPLSPAAYRRTAALLHLVGRPLCWAAARADHGGALEAVAARPGAI